MITHRDLETRVFFPFINSGLGTIHRQAGWASGQGQALGGSPGSRCSNFASWRWKIGGGAGSSLTLPQAENFFEVSGFI